MDLYATLQAFRIAPTSRDLRGSVRQSLGGRKSTKDRARQAPPVACRENAPVKMGGGTATPRSKQLLSTTFTARRNDLPHALAFTAGHDENGVLRRNDDEILHPNCSDERAARLD